MEWRDIKMENMHSVNILKSIHKKGRTMSAVSIIDTNEENIHQYGFCGTKSSKHKGYNNKVQWLCKRFLDGLKFKILLTEDESSVGMIEYIPGDYAWRAVDAKDYMFIHCLLVHQKKIREQGYGGKLIEECERDALEQRMQGVAIMTSKGSWMAGKDIFIKRGYKVVDYAKPGFELLVKKYGKAKDPKFKGNWEEKLLSYGKNLTILFSDQCPNIDKGHNDIIKTCKEHHIKVNVIKMESYKQAQEAPSPYSIYNIIYNGSLLAEHPISNTRFLNILKSVKLL